MFHVSSSLFSSVQACFLSASLFHNIECFQRLIADCVLQKNRYSEQGQDNTPTRLHIVDKCTQKLKVSYGRILSLPTLHGPTLSNQTHELSLAIAVRAFHSSSSLHSAHVLDGKRIASQWISELSKEVTTVTNLIKRPPGLAVILVGNRPDSLLYVAKKQEACHRAGVEVFLHHLSEEATQEDVEREVARVSCLPNVDGVLVQLPLPPALDESRVLDMLPPMKDVDGFHPLNMGRTLMRGRVPRHTPATPLGCMELLKREGFGVAGLSAVVLGDSNVVGTPLAALLRDAGAAAVTVCHRASFQEWFEDESFNGKHRADAVACLPRLPGPSFSSHIHDCDTQLPPSFSPPRQPAADQRSSTYGRSYDLAKGRDLSLENRGSIDPEGSWFSSHRLPDITRSADILVVAVGHPELVRASWVKPGVIVLDVGINVVPAADQPPETMTESLQIAAHDSQIHRDITGSGSGVQNGQKGYAATGSRSGSDSREQDSEEQLAATGSRSEEEGGKDQWLTGRSGHTSKQHDDDHHGSGSGARSRAGSSGEHDQRSGHGAGYHVVGDVAFDEVVKVASAITPVPGGVGPMTIAALIANTIRAARYNNGIDKW